MNILALSHTHCVKECARRRIKREREMKKREPFKSLSCLKRLKKACVVIATLAKKNIVLLKDGFITS
jgi:hypothetical protein